MRSKETCRTAMSAALGGALLAGAALTGPARAEDSEIANIDKHFEVASKYFGDGVVQMNARDESADAPLYAVHQFDCVNKTFTTPFEGTVPPDVFPVTTTEAQVEAFDENDPIAPLAQHACTKHGHPLLEW